MILFGGGLLRNVAREFVTYYHAERNHQGISNILILPAPSLKHRKGPILC